MYAITETSFRAITDGMNLNPGEARVSELPDELLTRIAAERVRAERTRRLRATDWTQAPDSPLAPEPKLAWAAYRQGLRDLPEQAGFPNCTWPAPPELPEGAAGQERSAL